MDSKLLAKAERSSSEVDVDAWMDDPLGAFTTGEETEEEAWTGIESLEDNLINDGVRTAGVVLDVLPLAWGLVIFNGAEPFEGLCWAL